MSSVSVSYLDDGSATVLVGRVPEDSGRGRVQRGVVEAVVEQQLERRRGVTVKYMSGLRNCPVHSWRTYWVLHRGVARCGELDTDGVMCGHVVVDRAQA